MSIRQLAKRARKIDVQKLALSVVQENSGLIDKRIQDQLTVGENGDGGAVGLYTSNRYSSFKSRIGSLAPSGVVDLKLSGNLYKGVNTKFQGKTFNTDSNVNYSKYQVDRYGKKIYELQKENSEDIKFKNSFDTVNSYTKLLGL